MKAIFTGLLANGMATQGRALRFDPTQSHHVDHGAFWLAGVDYTTFYWDYFVRPTQQSGTGYVISAGYGGAHNLLAGFTSDGARASVTGNIYNGSNTTSFESAAIIPLGDWVHVAVVWDLSNIMVYVNGVCEGITAYSALTRSTPSAVDSVLYVGGSNHLNGGFDLKWLRGFEGCIPPDVSYFAPFRAERYPKTHYVNSGTLCDASFTCDYTVTSEMQIDMSDGLSSIRHNGRRSGFGDQGDWLNLAGEVNTWDDASLPQWVNATVNVPTEKVTAIPAGALIYDDFNRTSSPFWTNSVALGSTEGGSLGVLAWQGAASSYGCTYGRAFYNGPGGGANPVYVDVGQQDVDIQLIRSGRYDVYARYTDANNYVLVYGVSDGSQDYLMIQKTIAGVSTDLSYVGIGANTQYEPDIRITIIGTTITVYYGGTQKGTATSTLPTGTNIGFALGSSTLGKIDTFAVY